jgi:hypothetical protein
MMSRPAEKKIDLATSWVVNQYFIDESVSFLICAFINICAFSGSFKRK